MTLQSLVRTAGTYVHSHVRLAAGATRALVPPLLQAGGEQLTKVRVPVGIITSCLRRSRVLGSRSRTGSACVWASLHAPALGIPAGTARCWRALGDSGCCHASPDVPAA